MIEDPANEISSCGCHCHASGNRFLTAMLVICGIGGIGVGIFGLARLASPDFGVGPFAKIDDAGELTHVLLAIRRAAFLTIGLGIVTTLIGMVSGRRDARMKCAK